MHHKCGVNKSAAIMLIWIKISEECFKHLIASMPQINKAGLKAIEGSTLHIGVYRIVPNITLVGLLSSFRCTALAYSSHRETPCFKCF